MVAATTNGLTLLSTTARFPKNPLLVRDTVGKNRPTVYDLPGEDHVYGKKIERDPEECAATVLQHWNIKATSKHAVPALDYITMNRNSARQGIISPKDIRYYREKNPVRVKIGDHAFGMVNSRNSPPGTKSGLRFRGPLPSDANSNFTYGKPTRPSTPVSSLMTDRFQKEWLQQHEKRELEMLAVEKEKAKKKHHNKTVVPRMHVTPKKNPVVKDSKPFIMSKFKKVPAKISSQRPKSDPAIVGLTARIETVQITNDTNGAAKAAEVQTVPKKPAVHFEL